MRKWATCLQTYTVQALERRMLLSVNLFSDTNPGSAGTTSTAFVFDANGLLYFNADDGTHGIEFWKTNGTSDGTVMVADINPTGSLTPAFLVNLNGELVFTADDGSHGRELWFCDGTNVTLDDIRPGPSQSIASGFTLFNNRDYFAAQDGTHGIELWVTDGTAGGTQQVCDIDAGNNQFGPSNITVYNGNLYFAETFNPDGIELFKSDGVVGDAATEVKNINPTGSSSPSNFAVFNNLLYFSADDGTHGPELWVTDGTDANTQMVKDINPFTTGITGSSPTGLTVFNGSLYFDADSGTTGPELYKSDGTTAGTNKLKDINPTINGSGFSLPTIFNNALYFVSTNGTNGLELFRTDGTATGTVMVRDINPGSTGAFTANNISMRVFNGSLYFYANDATHGNEVWKLTPPSATSTGFNVNTQSVTVTFNEPGAVSTTAALYTIQNLAGGATFSPLSVSYDSPSRTASFALPAGLADGNYRLTIPATSATDAYGNWLASSDDANFFILAGDADHSGAVDTADFTILAQHFNQTGATFGMGDFNSDGVVNAMDFNTLATKFGTSLPGPTLAVAGLFANAPINILDRDSGDAALI